MFFWGGFCKKKNIPVDHSLLTDFIQACEIELFIISVYSLRTEKNIMFQN